jgi:aryl-alcohol dehydrogenase-like predicted oxidoreductase
MQGAECQQAVESALGLGYRHVDTSEMYGNEEAVGAAIAASGLARDQLHVTTKVWHEHLAPEAILRAFDASLDRLGLDHVDLYLVHWPSADMDLPAVLSTLMRLKDEGRTRAIGVANFTLPMLRQAIEEIGASIACNQVEHHMLPAVQGHPADRLLPAGAGTGHAKPRACADRREAWRIRRAGRAQMAARSRRRRCDPQGRSRRQPARQPRRAVPDARR